jgi:hypothetical protein
VGRITIFAQQKCARASTDQILRAESGFPVTAEDLNPDRNLPRIHDMDRRATPDLPEGT